MNQTIVDTIVALFIFGYFLWAGFTVYFIMIGKKIESGATVIGKIIWYHGYAVIITMVVVVALTSALLLSRYLWFAMRFRIFIG